MISGEIVKNLGYVGLAIAVFVTNATLFIGIPTPSYVVLAVLLGLNPILVTLVSGISSALGESTGYALGYGSKKIIEMKYRKEIKVWKKTFEKYGFLAVVAIAALPFPPDDVAGVLAGVTGYDFKKFLLATFIGKTIKYGITVLIVVYGVNLFS